jgi:hypothetical protein
MELYYIDNSFIINLIGSLKHAYMRNLMVLICLYVNFCLD